MVGFVKTHNMDNPPLIAELPFIEVSKEVLAAAFPTTVRLLPDYDPAGPRGDLLALGLPPVPDWAALYARPADPVWARLDEVWRVPQDSPHWKGARRIVGGVTASNLAKFALLTHPSASGRLDIPDGMRVKGTKFAVDPAWEEFCLRLLDPRAPDYPLDAVSATFTTWGKLHENNALATFMAHNDIYIYEDCGLRYLTPAILAKWEFKDLLAPGQPVLRTLPFVLAASPDGVLTNKETGVRENCEWKAATAFLPKHGSAFFGVEADWRHAKPYEHIKSYYVPQVMLQMLVCGTESAIFGCWTYSNGMNLWKIPFNRDIMEITITLMLHLHRRFANPASPEFGRVPVNYFHKSGPPEARAPEEARALHETLISHVADVVRIAPYATLDGDMCFNTINRILRIDRPRLPIPTPFPQCSYELPHYLLLGVLAHYFVGDACARVKDPLDADARTDQILALAGMPADQFVLGAERANANYQPLTLDGCAFPLAFSSIILGAIVRAPHSKHPVVARHPLSRLARLAFAEKYLYWLLLPLYRLHEALRPVSEPADRAHLLAQALHRLYAGAAEATSDEVGAPLNPRAAVARALAMAGDLPDEKLSLPRLALHVHAAAWLAPVGRRPWLEGPGGPDPETAGAVDGANVVSHWAGLRRVVEVAGDDGARGEMRQHETRAMQWLARAGAAAAAKK